MDEVSLGSLSGAAVFEAAVRQMQEAVVVADRDGIIRVWNRGAEVLFGFGAREAKGANLSLLVPEKHRRAHEDGYRRAIASGQLRAEGRVLTTRSNHKYGCRLYVDFSFSLLKDPSGAVCGVIAVGRDATARQLDEAARKALAS